ncbi:MAG: carnitine dehydratase [Rhodospirillaceae bacterium]|nr:carnitine dehydratase [Rhodospirillaceae bacterium]HAA91423.1 carnitine dehydratase [Rhodospirillaceae bacterium]
MSTPQRPLEGLRVLDIATYIASPFCATLMAEFGAEVIKVELPGVGDPCRKLGTPDDCGDTLVWLSEARNKKSVTLDLRQPAGAELFKKLVSKCDVVTENFQPGTLERWNLGWEVLHEVNPKMVMLRVSGYGQTGPYSGKPGFGRIGNAFGGISFLAGDPDRAPATPGSATLADYLAGVFGGFGVMAALRHADATGVGQYIDVGLYEPIFRILDELAPAYDKGGYIRERMGAATVNVCPHSHYPTKDGRWVAIACTNDKIFARLAELIGHRDFANEGKYGTIQQREADRAGVDGMVTDWTMQYSQKEVVALCDEAQVPCGIVAAVDEIFENEQYAARENITRPKDDRADGLAVPNVVPRLSETPGGIEWLGPALGQHNEEIYSGLLGLSESDLEALRETKVI